MRDAMTGYCLAVVITQQAKKILSLQMSTDCTATLTHLSEGLDSSITSVREDLELLHMQADFGQSF